MRIHATVSVLITVAAAAAAPLRQQPTSPAPALTQWRRHLGDPDVVLKQFFAAEVKGLAEADTRRAAQLTEGSAAQRRQAVARARASLREMLGLEPLPPRTDLQVTVTSSLRDDELGIQVDKLH
ncbi:MAG: hypothetical protein GY722_21805, partial [bacterium]|nr:hypothetical protein [bacterium]